MKEYYRIELEITFDLVTETYKRDELKMHWRKPLPQSPFIQYGTDIIRLADHSDIAQLIEKTTQLAVPIGLNINDQSH